jgi:hypothetical protein
MMCESFSNLQSARIAKRELGSFLAPREMKVSGWW